MDDDLVERYYFRPLAFDVERAAHRRRLVAAFVLWVSGVLVGAAGTWWLR